MSLLLLSALVGSTDVATIDRAIAICDRATLNPVFAAEAQRRSDFLGQVFAEQDAIFAERADTLARRRAIREGHVSTGDSDQALALKSLALDDRQRVLDDQRRLEALRIETLDAKRRIYLARCANGKE